MSQNGQGQALARLNNGIGVANVRILKNGAIVTVRDAKRPRFLVLTAKALKAAVPHDPERCAIAIQAKMDTGHHFEVYRRYAYEQVSKFIAVRYLISSRGREVQMLNDLGRGKALYNEAFVIQLMVPPKCDTLEALRRRVKTWRKRNKRTRLVGPSMAQILSFRPRA